MDPSITAAAARIADLFQALISPALTPYKLRILRGVLIPELTAIDQGARRETLEMILQASGPEEEAQEGQLDLKPTSTDGEPPALRVSMTEDGGLSFGG